MCNTGQCFSEYCVINQKKNRIKPRKKESGIDHLNFISFIELQFPDPEIIQVKIETGQCTPDYRYARTSNSNTKLNLWKETIN